MYGSWTTLARISWPQKTRTGGRTDNLRDVVGLDVRADSLLHRRQGVEVVSGLGWQHRGLRNHQKGPMRLLGFHPVAGSPKTTEHQQPHTQSAAGGHNTGGNLHHHHDAGASPLSLRIEEPAFGAPAAPANAFVAQPPHASFGSLTRRRRGEGLWQ
jgi:hypothetical protein